LLGVDIGGEPSERGVAARHDIARIARPGQRVVEAAEVSRCTHPQDLASPDNVAHEVVGREVADRARRARGLVDIPVVENELVAPGGQVVEIMLPAAADDGAAIVATQAGLHGGFPVCTRRSIEAIVEEGHGPASWRGGRACSAALLKRVQIVLIQ
jgi:hypothetical protein